MTIPPRYAGKILAKVDGHLNIHRSYVGRGQIRGQRVGVSQAYFYVPVNNRQIEVEVENNTSHPVIIDRDAHLGYVEEVATIAKNLDAKVAAKVDLEVRKINSSIHANL